MKRPSQVDDLRELAERHIVVELTRRIMHMVDTWHAEDPHRVTDYVQDQLRLLLAATRRPPG